MAQSLVGNLLLADVVAINVGLSLALGSLASDRWLRDAGSTWSDVVRARSSLARRAGLTVTLLGLLGAVWLQAAVMGESSLMQAGPTAWVLLRDTHFGHAALAGGVAWCVVAAASWGAEPGGRTRLGLVGLGLAAFVWSRGTVAHAGSQGDVSVDILIDAAHMLAACLWVGMVLLATSIPLPAIGAPAQQKLDAKQWVAALSSTATAALAVVGITGAVKVWRTGSGLTSLVATDYGSVLGIKVALVAAAAALGGFNRFRVLPALFASLRTDAASPVDGPWRRRLKQVLSVEATVLLLVLLAAAVLAGTEPPGS